MLSYRLELCDLSNFSSNSIVASKYRPTYFDLSEKWKLIEFLLIVLTPMICLFGIVTSSLVVFVVAHKSNLKELENNHYKFMKLNAIVNIVILVIEPIDFLTECQGYVMGLICSPLRFSLFVQFLKIILVEYLSNVLRILSNFVYVGFAINRLSLVGKEHGKFVTRVSELSVGQFLKRVILVCAVLPVVKIFHSFPNSYDPLYEYPFTSTDWYPRVTDSLLFVYLSFELLFNLVNYFMFLLVNFVIDILLAVRMKRTLGEKAAHRQSIYGILPNSVKTDPKKLVHEIKLLKKPKV